MIGKYTRDCSQERGGISGDLFFIYVIRFIIRLYHAMIIKSFNLDVSKNLHNTQY